jgi:hypothetical protein
MGEKNKALKYKTRNNMKNIKQNIKQEIMEEISDGKVRMKSEYIFMLKTTLAILFVLFLSLFSIYIFSFLAFLSLENYNSQISNSGLFSILKNIKSLPLTLVFIGSLGVYLTSKSTKYFNFGYKKQTVDMVLYSLIFIILSQLIFIFSGGQKMLKEEAFRRRIQLVPVDFLKYRQEKIEMKENKNRTVIEVMR